MEQIGKVQQRFVAKWHSDHHHSVCGLKTNIDSIIREKVDIIILHRQRAHDNSFVGGIDQIIGIFGIFNVVACEKLQITMAPFMRSIYKRSFSYRDGNLYYMRQFFSPSVFILATGYLLYPTASGATPIWCYLPLVFYTPFIPKTH